MVKLGNSPHRGTISRGIWPLILSNSPSVEQPGSELNDLINFAAPPLPGTREFTISDSCFRSSLTQNGTSERSQAPRFGPCASREIFLLLRQSIRLTFGIRA